MGLFLLEKNKVMSKKNTKFSLESYQYLQNLLPAISQFGHKLEIYLFFKRISASICSQVQYAYACIKEEYIN